MVIKSDLLAYGLRELDVNFDYILSENSETIEDLTSLVFKYSLCNCTLTYSTKKAEEEIFENYSMNEIFEFLYNCGFTMQDATENLNVEKIHILLCEKNFEEYIQEIYESNKEYMPDLSEKDLIKSVFVTLIETGDLDKDLNVYPELLDIYWKKKEN